jgi:hypothetical protein
MEGLGGGNEVIFYANEAEGGIVAKMSKVLISEHVILQLEAE